MPVFPALRKMRIAVNQILIRYRVRPCLKKGKKSFLVLMQWQEEFYGNLCIQLGCIADRSVNDQRRKSLRYIGPCLVDCSPFEESQWSSLAFCPFLSGKFFCSHRWEFALPLHLSACGACCKSPRNNHPQIIDPFLLCKN